MNSFKSELERRTFKKLKKYGKIQYEVRELPYVIARSYLPDFEVKWLREGVYQTTYVETKGYFSPEDRQKMRLVIEQHPDLDIRILFMSDNKINRRSKMRYSDWCNKQGIRYAIREIPKDWFSTTDQIRTVKSIESCSPSVGIE